MRKLALWFLLPLLSLLISPAFGADSPWNQILLRDGSKIIGQITDASNRTYQITLFDRTIAVDVSDVVTILPNANDLDAGVYFVYEAGNSLSHGRPERTMMLLKSGLRLLRDYIPTSDKELATLNQATGRGYMLGARMFIQHNELEKARDTYRHILVRYPKVPVADEARDRLDYVTTEIVRRQKLAASGKPANLSWSDLFDQEFPATSPASPRKLPVLAQPRATEKPNQDTTADATTTEPLVPEKLEPAITVGAIVPVVPNGPKEVAVEPVTDPLQAVRESVHHWFPLRAGNLWRYKLGDTEETVMIDWEERIDQEILFHTTTTIQYNGETLVEKGLLVLNASGLYRREGEGDDPLLIFPIEIKEPTAYNYKKTEGTTTLSLRYTSRGVRVELPETVKAQQQSFESCLNVQLTSTIQLAKNASVQVVSHKYFAKGIGMVKESISGNPSGEGKHLIEFKLRNLKD